MSVTSARLVHKVSPEYPKKARKKHVEGVVRLHAIIGKDGAVRELAVISGDPLLTDAALKAVRQWRYMPTLLNGEPVEVDTTIDVNFVLNH
jgi:protein TonB